VLYVALERWRAWRAEHSGDRRVDLRAPFEVRRGRLAVTPPLPAQVSGPGEGHTVAVGPLEQIVFKATGSTTGDAFEFLEMRVQPGGGPPDHVHRDHDEAYYMCAGALRVPGQ
jgi:mannose-6-phosphate isomerase-like protein (cupin superfamily)